MPKGKSFGPEYSHEREIKVILEDMQGQFRVFGEGMQGMQRNIEDVQERLGRVENKVDRIEVIEEDVRQIKSFMKPLTAQVSDHEHRITALEKSD